MSFLSTAAEPVVAGRRLSSVFLDAETRAGFSVVIDSGRSLEATIPLDPFFWDDLDEPSVAGLVAGAADLPASDDVEATVDAGSGLVEDDVEEFGVPAPGAGVVDFAALDDVEATVTPGSDFGGDFEESFVTSLVAGGEDFVVWEGVEATVTPGSVLVEDDVEGGGAPAPDAGVVDITGWDDVEPISAATMAPDVLGIVADTWGLAGPLLVLAATVPVDAPILPAGGFAAGSSPVTTEDVFRESGEIAGWSVPVGTTTAPFGAFKNQSSGVVVPPANRSGPSWSVPTSVSVSLSLVTVVFFPPKRKAKAMTSTPRTATPMATSLRRPESGMRSGGRESDIEEAWYWRMVMDFPRKDKPSAVFRSCGIRVRLLRSPQHEHGTS